MDIAVTKTPDFWIKDYWNVWNSIRMDIYLAEQTGDEIDRDPALTFQEYVQDKVYLGQKCDLGIIPRQFIHQSNRLVRIYNHLISQEEVDTDKVKRLVDMVLSVTHPKETSE